MTHDEADYESDEVYTYIGLVRGQVVANSLDDAAAAARIAVLEHVQATLYVGAGGLERLPAYLRVAFSNYVAQSGLVAATGRLTPSQSQSPGPSPDSAHLTDKAEVQVDPRIQLHNPPLSQVSEAANSGNLPSWSW